MKNIEELMALLPSFKLVKRKSGQYNAWLVGQNSLIFGGQEARQVLEKLLTYHLSYESDQTRIYRPNQSPCQAENAYPMD